jgi:hypothetical protein
LWQEVIASSENRFFFFFSHQGDQMLLLKIPVAQSVAQNHILSYLIPTFSLKNSQTFGPIMNLKLIKLSYDDNISIGSPNLVTLFPIDVAADGAKFIMTAVETKIVDADFFPNICGYQRNSLSAHSSKTN